MKNQSPQKKLPPTALHIARKNNLFAIIGEKHGDVRAFSEKYGLSEQTLYQVKNNRREIGDRMARGIEEKMNLVRGALDSRAEDNAPHDPFTVQIAAEASRRSVPPEMRETIMYLLRMAPDK